MKKTIAFLSVLLFAFSLWAQKCKVNAQTLNVRSKAERESSVLATLTSGQDVKILQETTIGGWVKISSGKVSGYVPRKYLSCGTSNTVWVCLGGSAYAYHKSNACQGIRRCKASIVKVSETDAKNKYGRKPCRYCY